MLGYKVKLTKTGRQVVKRRLFFAWTCWNISRDTTSYRLPYIALKEHIAVQDDSEDASLLPDKLLILNLRHFINHFSDLDNITPRPAPFLRDF